MKSIKERIREILIGPLSYLDESTREDITRRIITVLEEEIVQERQRAVQCCEQRAELWENTKAAQPGSPQQSREEARARQNEASCLADLIAVGKE